MKLRFDTTSILHDAPILAVRNARWSLVGSRDRKATFDCRSGKRETKTPFVGVFVRRSADSCAVTALINQNKPWSAGQMESAKELQGRILLVDDESAILRTFRYCLEDEGYTVATANSAAQADALLQRQVFDLCFLDLRLGEDNGLDVLAQMRIQAPWMRVVIVTAHSAVDTAVDAIQAGAADYLVKPCSPDQLRLATAKQLEVRQLSARLEALEGAPGDDGGAGNRTPGGGH
eukprot:gene13657-16621_t